LVDVTPKLCDECPNSGILACGISKLGKQFSATPGHETGMTGCAI